MRHVVYRMCGCEVEEYVMTSGYVVVTLLFKGYPVAEFKSRRAAIHYLANEFLIPLCH